MPSITRAASKLLESSLAVVDRSSAVLSVAARSRDEEERLRSGDPGMERRALEVGGESVGELRLRSPGEGPDRGLVDLVATVLALEVERTRSEEWADEAEAAALVDAVLERELTTSDEIAERAERLGLNLEDGAGVVTARVEAGREAPDDWAARALSAGLRPARTGGRGSLAARRDLEGCVELRALVPCPETSELAGVAVAIRGEIEGSIRDVKVTVGHSRHAARADELYRAGREALLALNVAEAEGADLLAFEETGSYRLLLSTMSENPDELEWFYSDTVAPLVTYDEQYGTDLMATVEAFLANDGNIGPTAEQLFAHRHTVRYRLGRVRDLCGYDIQSTDGRERLGFGLKVMRVLGIGSRREPR